MAAVLALDTSGDLAESLGTGSFSMGTGRVLIGAKGWGQGCSRRSFLLLPGARGVGLGY